MAAPTPAVPDLGNSLAMAMIAASEAPQLLLDRDLKVIAASASFCRAFRIDPGKATDIAVFSLGSGEWDAPRLRSLLTATVSGHADIDRYEMDLTPAGGSARRLVLHVHKLVYDDDVQNSRLLLTVTDVTDARENDRVKDGLMRDKAVLLHEVQHRVANSLQIIASVLLQSARKVQSAETRIHLHDAHHRVMSIAAVQRQLASSAVGYVELRPYFKQLCQSLGASMISDHHRITIGVTVDGSVVGADKSVSLGLVVTELVINALKHAFPDDRTGRISVDYRSFGADWELSVADDGVGIPIGAVPTKSGLGSSIVKALAAQLGSVVSIETAAPGAKVRLIHKAAGAGANDADVAPSQEAV